MTSRLFDAITDGDLSTTRALIEGNEDIDVNTRNLIGWTPLHEACFHARLQIAKYLIQDKKAIADAVDRRNRTPLFCLCLSTLGENAAEIAELLLANGASAATKGGPQSHSALHMACHFGNTRLVQVLLNHGAHINTRSCSGETPLHYACLNKHVDLIKLLLANNADRHIQGNSGYGPTNMPGLGEIFTSYDKWPLGVPEISNAQHPTTCKKYTQQDGSVRLNPRLSQHQHALALKALLLVRKLPVHEVAYQILGFLSPAAVETIFMPAV